jgi:hypothetical protein
VAFKEVEMKPISLREYLDNLFSYHAPFGDQPARYHEIRENAKGMALLFQVTCPPSDELEHAMKALQEACFWANAAIARNEVPAPPETEAVPPQAPAPDQTGEELPSGAKVVDRRRVGLNTIEGGIRPASGE